MSTFVKFLGFQHNLDSMSTPHLAEMHNKAAEITGGNPVKRFADKKSAVRRTAAAVEAANNAAKAPEAPSTNTTDNTEKASTAVDVPKVKKARTMHFEFKPDSDGIRTVKSPESLRGRAVAMLINGATLTQVKQLVKIFDVDRGKGNAETIDRRAYELVRIMHYYLGYGITKNEDGVITIYTK